MGQPLAHRMELFVTVLGYGIYFDRSVQNLTQLPMCYFVTHKQKVSKQAIRVRLQMTKMCISDDETTKMHIKVIEMICLKYAWMFTSSTGSAGRSNDFGLLRFNFGALSAR